MHCRVCFLGGRKGHFSPLTSALRHDPRNACPSPRLPAAGRFQSAPSATYRIQLRHYALKSRPTSPPNSSDVHAAHNLDQIEKIDEMSDAVGLGTNHDLDLCSMSIRARALSWTLTATTAVVAKKPEMVRHIPASIIQMSKVPVSNSRMLPQCPMPWVERPCAGHNGLGPRCGQ